MSLFKSILDKLGIGKKAPTAGTATAAKPSAPAAAKPAAGARPGGFSSQAPSIGGSAPAAKASEVPMVDVVSKLEAMAKANPEKLDWKVSIVDLLKLLGLDSSFDARKSLATELGCPADLMGDSAKMNTWLHKTVLKKIAENGGNIPASLLD